MTAELKKEERTWAAFCHLGGFGMFVIPLVGNIVLPLILWMLKREESKFVDRQGKEAVDFQITVSIAAAAGGLLCLIFIGIPITLAILIYDVVIMTMASVRTAEGGSFTYPLSFRFLQHGVPWLNRASETKTGSKASTETPSGPSAGAVAKNSGKPAQAGDERKTSSQPDKEEKADKKPAKKASSGKSSKKKSGRKSTSKSGKKSKKKPGKKSGKKSSKSKKSGSKTGGKSSGGSSS